MPMGKVIIFVIISIGSSFFVGYWLGGSARESYNATESGKVAMGYLITETDIASIKAVEKEKEKVVYRDVIKYIKDPDRTRCDFDPDAVRLRQQAIDAANSTPGFDVAPLQNKQRGKQ